MPDPVDGALTINPYDEVSCALKIGDIDFPGVVGVTVTAEPVVDTVNDDAPILVCWSDKLFDNAVNVANAT